MPEPGLYCPSECPSRHLPGAVQEYRYWAHALAQVDGIRRDVSTVGFVPPEGRLRAEAAMDAYLLCLWRYAEELGVA